MTYIAQLHANPSCPWLSTYNEQDLHAYRTQRSIKHSPEKLIRVVNKKERFNWPGMRRGSRSGFLIHIKICVPSLYPLTSSNLPFYYAVYLAGASLNSWWTTCRLQLQCCFNRRLLLLPWWRHNTRNKRSVNALWLHHGAVKIRPSLNSISCS